MFELRNNLNSNRISMYQQILANHQELRKRKNNTDARYKKAKDLFETLEHKGVSIYTVGSIGRDELGTKSDLDLFFIAEDKISRLEEHKLFAKAIQFNNELKFEDFSNEGEFLQVHVLNKVMQNIGNPKDDNDNFFTARMLLLLESKPLFNKSLFDDSLHKIISFYFRDFNNNQRFVPLFFLNDLLRFWRTLCLNYESARHEPDKPVRKKNLNLKYSRMITVFSTVLYVLTEKELMADRLVEMCGFSPLERLAKSLDALDNPSFKEEFEEVLEIYESFLTAKESGKIESDDSLKEKLDADAEKLSDFVYNVLMSDEVNKQYKKYLVI